MRRRWSWTTKRRTHDLTHQYRDRAALRGQLVVLAVLFPVVVEGDSCCRSAGAEEVTKVAGGREVGENNVRGRAGVRLAFDFLPRSTESSAFEVSEAERLSGAKGPVRDPSALKGKVHQFPFECHPFALASLHFGKQLYHSLLSALVISTSSSRQTEKDSPMSMNPSPYAGHSQSHPSPLRAGQCMNQSCLYARSSKLRPSISKIEEGERGRTSGLG